MRGSSLIGAIWKKRNRFQVGNAQLQGYREIQSNYFSSATNDAGELFLVLADGAVDNLSGRRAAVIAVKHCILAFDRGKLSTPDAESMRDIAIAANVRIREEIYFGIRPHVSLTMVLFTTEGLHCFNVGDNIIYFYNRHNEQEPIYSADNLFFYVRFELPPKRNLVGIYSNGVHTVTHPMERMKAVWLKKKTANDKAQSLIDCIETKNLTNQLNATALLVEVVK